jgi:hypothetical protein
VASGLLKAGVDLDTLFRARVSAKRADVGFKVGGTDISNRYETIGGAAAIAATGFKAASIDLASLFLGASQHSLTAGAGTVTPGYTFIGLFVSLAVGSITPTTFGGLQILAMADQTNTGDSSINGFIVQLNTVVAQSFFNTITINGRTYTSASSAFSTGSASQWRWPTYAGLANTGVYPVGIS